MSILDRLRNEAVTLRQHSCRCATSCDSKLPRSDSTRANAPHNCDTKLAQCFESRTFDFVNVRVPLTAQGTAKPATNDNGTATARSLSIFDKLRYEAVTVRQHPCRRATGRTYGTGYDVVNVRVALTAQGTAKPATNGHATAIACSLSTHDTLRCEAATIRQHPCRRATSRGAKLPRSDSTRVDTPQICDAKLAGCFESRTFDGVNVRVALPAQGTAKPATNGNATAVARQKLRCEVVAQSMSVRDKMRCKARALL